ncbi:MAG: hypothetical protein HKP52_12535 [Desulfofustis sp.]|nr:hypothetical protein [Desulfofustis sp.]
MRFNTCNYSVVIDLQSAEFCLHQNQIVALERALALIGSVDPTFAEICALKNGVLRYESIALLPPMTNVKKQKVLLVLGNPSISSVTSGMIFYARRDGGRHGFWTKLARAHLMTPVADDNRRRESDNRRTKLLDDDVSPHYSLGITTFYSFPTPGSDDQPYCGSAGVEKIFEPVLKQIRLMEIRRLLRHPFIDGSILIFTRKSLLKHFYKTTGIKPVHWPIRGEASSGEELARILSESNKVITSATPLLF